MAAILKRFASQKRSIVGYGQSQLTIAQLPATRPFMTPLRIALEWFLNPDHLPLISAREQLRAEGWDIDLVDEATFEAMFA